MPFSLRGFYMSDNKSVSRLNRKISAQYEGVFFLGNVYTCGGFVGKKEMIESTSNIKNKNYYKRIETMPLKKCFLCSFFPVCMGGCQFETHELGSHCQKIYLREIYDEYFSKYAEQTKL